MAFINKILQKTKNKISDRDSSSGMSPPTERSSVYTQYLDSPTDPTPLPNSPLGGKNYGVSPGVASSSQPPMHEYPYQQQHHVSVPYKQSAPQLQKHMVPSNAAPGVQSLTSMATRAASFSAGASGYTAPQTLYPGQQPIQYQNTAYAQQQQTVVQPQSQPQQQQPQQQQQWEQSVPLQTTKQPYEDKHVRLDEFEVFRTVGTGSFGRVRLVRHKVTNKYYAMKVLKKGHVVRAKQVEHVNSERRILAECNCPFIVNMLGTCQDRINLYFFMEYVVGGELFTYLRRYHRFPPPVAKFYAAEVLLALEYMHERNIIWRDTKPENILLDDRGHVKLTDMGFAKKVVDRTWTLCGTPDYLAPEVIQAKGYGKSVDWWALGILIFEMIAGYPPFYDEDHYRLYEKILAGRIQWPAEFDPVARDLVSRLLTADLSRRLGNLHRGSADIKEHRWFAEVDWNRLAAREIPAPLIPPQKVDGDTSNFDKYPETAETYGDTTSEDPYSELFLEF
ncbi:cAMP-dependent protein kinase catalytic subunit [Kickxella alabastrina]|nr:cAMP-dependent protein kinase catalytic subunit [Kickxella alabastrina]